MLPATITFDLQNLTLEEGNHPHGYWMAYTNRRRFPKTYRDGFPIFGERKCIFFVVAENRQKAEQDLLSLMNPFKTVVSCVSSPELVEAAEDQHRASRIVQ